MIFLSLLGTFAFLATGEYLKEIENATAKFSELYSKKSWDALSNFYTEHSLLMVPNSPPVNGKEGAINFLMNTWLNLNFDRAVLETIETSSLPSNLVYERGRYTYYSKDGNVIDEGKYIVIWKKILNDWKIFVDAPSSNVLDASTLTMSERDMIDFINEAYKKWLGPININFLEEIITEDFYVTWADGNKSDREQYIKKYQELQNSQKKISTFFE